MTYGPMASKIRCCATSQLYTYVKLKPLAGTQGPQVYRLQWCLRPWEYWQQRIYPSTDMHSSSGCHHQITSWHQNLLGYFFGNKAFHFSMLEWYQKDVWIACGTTHFFKGVFRPWRLIAFGQGQCVGVDLRGGSLFRWLPQGAKKWGQHRRITSRGGVRRSHRRSCGL